MKEVLPTWDLAALYPDLAAWERDAARIRPLTEKFAAYRGRLAESPAVLREAIEAQDAASRLTAKVYTYAHLLSDEDTGNNPNRARVDKLDALLASLAELEAWFEPEFMRIPDDRMREFLASPELAFYRRSIEELLRDKEHTLSEPEERILGTLSDVLGSSANTFELLNDADLSFGSVRDGSGQSVKLTHGSYRRLMEDSDRSVRRTAFRKLYRRYKEFRNTFASTLDGEIKCHAASAKLRKYPSCLAAALSDDNVPEAVYTNLIDTVHAKLDRFYPYMELRRKMMGLEKLDMYDIYNPLLPAARGRYTFQQAEQLVKAALAPLGEEYLRDLDRAFKERWIDAPERRGKRSGAYSSGCYDSFPYLLLNYNSTLDDVFTLAHELGHSMHSFYSHRAQKYHYAGYRIFVAEVASTTNEILLSEHLLRQAETKEQRAYLYGHLLDEIRGTVYRQTMFAEFELELHRKAEAGIPLSADELTRSYYDLNKLYYGDAVAADPLIGLEWARIPHFYYDFYVYKYATGMSAALVLAGNLLSGDPQKREAYLNFLRAGDSKDVLDIMKDAGVDLGTPAPVAAALDYFGETVKKLERELGL
ncbi:MAG: oligoendopeptidase F [Lentisphaeria bacterium]|nr:oligoendopeptidase F [Lentisphaeria bacterium]